MQFKKYVENLNALLEKHPETADYTVVSAADEEGNYFEEVVFSPVQGVFDLGSALFEQSEDPERVNAVCIN